VITKGKLTPHQREVYNYIVRVSRRRSEIEGGPLVHRWLNEGSIGSRGACAKLVEKGWIECMVGYGPRGGEHRQYRPLISEED
jgi:hypothetical protein